MKTVYVYDKETKLFLHPRLLADDDNTIIENSTEVPVPDGLWGKIKWTGQGWIGQTREEYEASLPKRDVEPTAQQKVLASVMKDVSAIKVDNKTQDTLNASLMKQLADQKVEQAKINASLLKEIASLKTANTTTTQQ